MGLVNLFLQLCIFRNIRDLRWSYRNHAKLLWIRDLFVTHSWSIRDSFVIVQIGGDFMILHIIFAGLYIFMTFSTLVFSLQQFSNNFEFSRMRLNKESRFAGCPLKIYLDLEVARWNSAGMCINRWRVPRSRPYILFKYSINWPLNGRAPHINSQQLKIRWTGQLIKLYIIPRAFYTCPLFCWINFCVPFFNRQRNFQRYLNVNQDDVF